MSTRSCLFILSYLAGIIPSYYSFRWLDGWLSYPCGRTGLNHRKRAGMAVAWPVAWVVLAAIAVFMFLVLLLVVAESIADEHVQQLKRWFNEGPA